LFQALRRTLPETFLPPAQLTLNIDQTPPSILQFTAPVAVGAWPKRHTATVNATDNIGALRPL